MGRAKKEGYSQRIYLGRDAETGNWVRKTVQGRTKKELQDHIDAAKKEFEQQNRAVANGLVSTNFKDFAEMWVANTKGNAENNTIEMYEWSIKRCKDFWHRDINTIKQIELQTLINSLTYDTAKKTVLLLRGVFNYAMANGLIDINPMATRLILPEKPKYEDFESDEDDRKEFAVKRALTEIERNAIKNADLKAEDRIFVSILYYFGLRREEALSLRPIDFNFRTNTLSVTRALAFGKGGCAPHIKSTKNKKNREVPIPAAIVEDLKEYFAEMDPKALLFTNQSGSMVTKSGYDKRWERILKAINKAMPEGQGLAITSHWLRHDYCTRLAYADLPKVSIQKRAQICGHSYDVFTRIYLHVDDSMEDLTGFDEAMKF